MHKRNPRRPPNTERAQSMRSKQILRRERGRNGLSEAVKQLESTEAQTRQEQQVAENEERAKLTISMLHEVTRRMRDESGLGFLKAALIGKEIIFDDYVTEFDRIVEDASKNYEAMKARQNEFTQASTIPQLLDAEDAARKKMMYVEHKTFEDVICFVDLSARNILRPPRDSTVNLFDGCPFIHSSQCPFHRHSWVDEKSLHLQHFHRKYPRLKRALALEHIDYQRILAARLEKARHVNCRMFSRRIVFGVSN